MELNPLSTTDLQPFLLVMAAAALDQWIGDPRGWLHPVQVIGWLINRARTLAEAWAGSRPWALRLSGVIITTTMVAGSGLIGWLLEQMALTQSGLLGWGATLLMVISLASALAGRSLARAVAGVLQALPNIDQARLKLAWIVGRDTTALNKQEILRAAAETASENAVDGLFAPLFWMLAGCMLWQLSTLLPGPLALAWMFKAASTLDSMLGYRRGQLLWLGTAGAKLDDILTWLPCRLVLVSLPLVSRSWAASPKLITTSIREAASDPSPNAGLSEAIFAHCAGVRMGGSNHYEGTVVIKPTLAANAPQAEEESIQRILGLVARLELTWLTVALLAAFCI